MQHVRVKLKRRIVVVLQEPVHAKHQLSKLSYLKKLGPTEIFVGPFLLSKKDGVGRSE